MKELKERLAQVEREIWWYEMKDRMDTEDRKEWNKLWDEKMNLKARIRRGEE